MNRTLITAAAGLAITTALLASPALSAPDAPGTGRLVPCSTDEGADGIEQTGCVWDARHFGNGSGRSFLVTPAGRVVYLPHYAAHALVFGSYGEGSPKAGS
jgi:hypothetical protein